MEGEKGIMMIGNYFVYENGCRLNIFHIFGEKGDQVKILPVKQKKKSRNLLSFPSNTSFRF